MQISSHAKYNYADSFDRLDEILNSSNTYEERDSIPNRDDLTFTNGYYVKCNAIFIDIRGSSALPEKYKRPTLARIYRSYISELVAIYSSYDTCKEINIVGDCVSGIFERDTKDQTKDVFAAGFVSASLVDTLNYKLCRKGYDPITIGIGISQGRALMIKAGYKGSGINDFVWMGDVVNHASNLCNEANKGTTCEIVISKDVWNDFKDVTNNDGEKYQDFFSYDSNKDFYHGNVINAPMRKWLNEQQAKNPCSR